MSYGEACRMLVKAGYTVRDRPPTKRTSFTSELIVLWDDYPVGVCFVKNGEISDLDVAQFCENVLK